MPKWEKAPIVEQPKWASAPLVSEPEPTFKGGQGGEFRGRGTGGEWEPESFLKQGIGALAIGSAHVGQAILEQPGRFVRNAGFIRQWSMAEDVLRETDPEKQAELRQQMALSRQAFDQVADALDTPAGEYQKGLDAMLKNHPEWEHDPPESFIELLTNPKEAALAVAEAIPLLVGAGIVTVTGHPNVGMGMIFAAESKSMSDQAFQDTGDKYTADMAGTLYGTVSAALEGMQLQGLVKLIKGSRKYVIGRALQKLGEKGFKNFSYGSIKIALQEAVEEMSQQGWQEFTAKAVYDKDVPGGLAGILDRLAQAGYLGLILSGGAGTVGVGISGLESLQQAAAKGEINEANVDTVAKQVQQIAAENGVSPEYVVGNIVVQREADKTISRFPQKITDQTSLENLGLELQAHLAGTEVGKGLNKWDVSWELYADLDNVPKGLKGAWGNVITSDDVAKIKEEGGYSDEEIDTELKKQGFDPEKLKGKNKAIVQILAPTGKLFDMGGREFRPDRKFAGQRARKAGEAFRHTQATVKRAMVHELAHIVNPALITKDGKRIGHTPKFARDTETMTKELFKTVPGEAKPVAEVERLPQPPAVPEAKAEPGAVETPQAEQPINVYKTVSGSRTGITEQEVKYDKETGQYTDTITGEDVILDQEASRGALQKPAKMAEVKPSKPKKLKLTKAKARDLGHTIPDLLGWDDAKRRDFMQELVGRRTMKGMSRADMNTVVEALQQEARDQGIELEKNLPVVPVNDLISTLETTKKKTEGEVYQTLNRGQIKSLFRKMKSGVYSFTTGLERMERFFESLDGHKAGAFTENIYKPVKQADELATEFTNQDKIEFIDYLEEQNINPDIWVGKAEEIPGTKFKLTPFQRVGVHMFSLNKSGYRHLVEGMGFTEKEIAIINNSLSTQEKEVVNWLSDKYEKQWKVLQNIGIQIGIDPKKLKKEVFYSPIIRIDADLEGQQNFLTGLSDAFQGENFDPEHKFLEPRKPSSRGKIELDAAVLYMNNIARTQRFIQMAPTAHSIGRLLNNKNFRSALNDCTYNQGIKLVNKWMHDAVRGSVIRDGTQLSKAINIMRRNGIIYAIGYNIPSSLRQTLSLSNAVAVDKAMLKYTPINLAKAFTPKGFKALQDFVYARSLSVKNASFDRDLRRIANRKNIRKQLKGKLEWSQKAISWIRWMDRHTRVVAWKSLYDVGMSKFNGDEIKAIDYADKWIGRTQPMATAKDLPHFFRGGQLEQLLTTFQNQVNNNANFYIYDILGATKSGEITLAEAGYRTMFSYVLPAILYGMIGRGGLPKDLKDIMVDLSTYHIAGLVIIGRWITAMIRGWDSGSTIAEAAPQQASRLVKAIKRGDPRDIISSAAGTIGAATGLPPAQPIRTIEGAIDLYTGETTDPRRLIYSEWALNQGKKEKKKVKMYGGGL